jgi:hypothetical protein
MGKMPTKVLKKYHALAVPYKRTIYGTMEKFLMIDSVLD